MSKAENVQTSLLGVEGGATRTTVLLVRRTDGEVLSEFETGPANMLSTSQGKLTRYLRDIASALPEVPSAVGIGLAGARSSSHHDRIRAAAASVWPGVPCAPSDDLMTALEATEWLEDCRVQTLVLSGTGSCFISRDRAGNIDKIGGRGHVIGDRGSACQIAQHALRAVVAISDNDGKVPPLGGDILAHLQFNELEDLIEWSASVTKTELAALAIQVFRAAARGDEIAQTVLADAARRLAKDAVTCAGHLAKEGEPVQFLFNGAVLTKNPKFAADVASRILALRENAIVTPLEKPSVWGAVALAGSLVGHGSRQTRPPSLGIGIGRAVQSPAAGWRPVASAPTEQRNPLSMQLDSLSIPEAIRMILDQDAKIPAAVMTESAAVEWTVDRVVSAFKAGGRLIYVGAGTSGRLGVLDASECPPTFRADPEMVQGIIAGGRQALWSAVEGAEDDPRAGSAAIAGRAVSEKDVVVGITASGHAPFVWGALEEAKSRGAAIVLLCCNPGYKDHPLPDQVIAVDTGPEVLTGSTRMKAGTATKLTLNLISTLAMVGIGKVMGNLMIDLKPSNSKLRNRAARIVAELSNASLQDSRRTLEENGWKVREAVMKLRRYREDL